MNRRLFLLLGAATCVAISEFDVSAATSSNSATLSPEARGAPIALRL